MNIIAKKKKKKIIAIITCLDSIIITWSHLCVTDFLAAMKIWALFSPPVSIFSFCISPWE